MGTVSEKKSKLEASQKLAQLGSINDEQRNKATNILVTFVKSRQSNSSEAILPDTVFVVKKLIQGLSDIKEQHKRVSYSTALCQILRTVKCIKTSFVLSYIEENFQALEKVVDLVNREVGRVLGWLALINSQCLKTSSAEQIGKLINNLLNSKLYVQLLCLTGLNEIISQVSHKAFQKNILPHLEEQFRSGWDNCTPFTFTLLLVANKHHPSGVKETIKKHWQNDQLVSVKNYSHIADILGKCSSCKHAMHPLVDLVLSAVKDEGLCVVKFWREVGNNILTSKINKGGGKFVLGLNILTRILPDVKSADKLREVVNSNVSEALIACTSPKADQHSKTAAKILIDNLTKYAVESKDKNTEIEVVRCLVHSAQSATTTNEMTNVLIKQISSASRGVIVEEILKTLVGKSSWILSDQKQSVTAVKQWSIRQLNFLCNIVEPSQHLSILQFLFLHTFFLVKQTRKDIPHCVTLTTDLSEYERKIMSDTCFKLLSRLLTRRDIGVPKVKNLNDHLDVLYNLAQYVHKVLQSTDNVQLLKTDTSVQVKKEWIKLWDVIKSVHIKRSTCKEDEISDTHPFELLFICSGLQLLADTDSVQETLQDLYVCHEKSNKKRKKSPASTDEPAWIDVVVELLLSMVFNDNFLSRVLAKQVMSFLTDHVTSSSIQLLVKALKQTSSGEMIGDGEDDDDDNDSENDEMNSDDENGAMEVDEDSDTEDKNGDIDDDDDESSDDDSEQDDDDDDDSDSEDSGIEEEVDVKVPVTLKEKVKAALGDAAALSNDDEGSEDEKDVEFSDSEMFKLDAVLASAFRSMRKGKKNEKQRELQLISFKTRVLDLVEVVIKGNNTPATCSTFVLPLFHLIENGMRKETEEILGNKANEILQMLLKQKLVKSDENADRDEWVDILEELMKYSKKIPIHSFVQNIGGAYLFMMKILLSDDALSPVRTRSKPAHKPKNVEYYQDKVVTMVETSVVELLERKPGHCPSAFIHVILTKYPVLFWQLNDVFMKTINSSDAKVYSRTQAAAFLADIVTEQTSDTQDPDAWNKFVNKWKNTAHKVITGESKGEKLAKGLLNEVVSLSYHLKTTCPELEVLSEADLHNLLEMHDKCDKLAKGVILKLTKGLKGASDVLKEKKQKKRKQNDKTDEIDGTTPSKKTKTVDQSEEDAVNQSSEKSMNLNQSVSKDLETPENTPKKQKKKKHKKKAEHSELNNSVENGMDHTEGHADMNNSVQESPKSTKKECNNSKLDESISTPSSSGKKHKKKNKNKSKKSDD